MIKNLWYVSIGSEGLELWLGRDGITADRSRAQPFDGAKYALAAIDQLADDMAARAGLYWNA